MDKVAQLGIVIMFIGLVGVIPIALKELFAHIKTLYARAVVITVASGMVIMIIAFCLFVMSRW